THGGTYAAAVTPAASGNPAIAAPLASLGQTETWTRFYFRYETLAGTAPVASGTDASGRLLWEIDFVASRKALRVTVWSGGGGRRSFDTTVGSFAPSVWNCVELRYRGTKKGYAELWENGTSMGALMANLSEAAPYTQLSLMSSVGSSTSY